MGNEHKITDDLIAWSDGDPEALERLMPAVFDELRKIAVYFFSGETPGHTLQPTALVNELYLRLANRRRVQWNNRAHFFGFAAQTVRRILVDHARGRHREKRGLGLRPLALDEVEGHSISPNLDLVALDEALDRLAILDARQARVVELRFFAGLTVSEVAAALKVTSRTVKRDWQTARLWLHQELREGQGVDARG